MTAQAGGDFCRLLFYLSMVCPLTGKRRFMTIEEMKAVDVRTVNRDDLVDIRDVHIDPDLPKEERIRSFVRQIRNPYVFKCGDVVIKSVFPETGPTLEECMEHYLRNR